MRRIWILVTALLLTAGVLGQTAPNDVGLTVQGRAAGSDGGQKPLLEPTRDGAMLPPCATGITQFSGSNSQMGRIFRDAIPSSCPSKAYPGIFNPGTPYFYETYTYSNSGAAAACVTVNFDPNPNNNLATDCDTNAHASAYIGSYDPMNQSANYVGDVGSSITDSFSFDVPAMSDLVLVVTNTSAEEVCDYQFEIVGSLDCEITDADLVVTKNADSTTATPGSALNYTVNVENLGPATATNVVVTDNLPAGLTFVSTTGCAEDPNGVPTCSLGNIGPNSSASYLISTLVDDNPPNAITNTVTATADNADPVSDNNMSTSLISTVMQVPILGGAGLAVLSGLLALGGVGLTRFFRRN